MERKKQEDLEWKTKGSNVEGICWAEASPVIWGLEISEVIGFPWKRVHLEPT